MSAFDISLIVILVGFVVSGLFKGIIKMVGGIFGYLAGAYFASRYYLDFYNWLDTFINGKENVMKIISFIIVFLLVSKIVSLIFLLLEKVFKLAAFIPGSRFLNNILGALFGFIQGALLMGLIVFLLSRYLNMGDSLAQLILSSKIAPILIKLNVVTAPILPEAFKSLVSFLKY